MFRRQQYRRVVPFYEKNRLWINEKNNLRSRKLRLKVLKKLGGKCVECGFDDWRALQIDHVNGGGTRELKKYYGRLQKYNRMVLADNNGKYQILCSNCNWIKRHERNEVPYAYDSAGKIMKTNISLDK